jgi:hypothetical protein
LITIIAHHSIRVIGDRWPDTLATHRASHRDRASHGKAGTAAFDALDAAHLHANATQRQAVRVVSGGFCVCASPYFVAKDGRIDTKKLKVLCRNL